MTAKSRNEVTITASGSVGSGKSALLGEIEILLTALGISYEWADPDAARQEKNLTGADWTDELERTKPHVVLVERIQRANADEQSVAAALLDRARVAEAEVARLRDLLDSRPAFNIGLVVSYSKWSSDVYKSDLAARIARVAQHG